MPESFACGSEVSLGKARGVGRELTILDHLMEWEPD